MIFRFLGWFAAIDGLCSCVSLVLLAHTGEASLFGRLGAQNIQIMPDGLKIRNSIHRIGVTHDTGIDLGYFGGKEWTIWIMDTSNRARTLRSCEAQSSGPMPWLR